MSVVTTVKSSNYAKNKSDKDKFLELCELKSEYEFLERKNNFLRLEQEQLKEKIGQMHSEIKRVQHVPLLVGQFQELIDENHAIVQGMGGVSFYVRILDTINKELLKPAVSVAMHRQSQAIVEILPNNVDVSIRNYQVSEKPDVKYTDIGGLEVQKQEIREAVELPLLCPELYENIGIEAPNGVLLYGPPGTGKTMLAKAVASSSSASFFSVVGSEFVQKYLGEGPRMVRDVFKFAKEQAPSIIFIDEVDTIATKRYDAQTGADREVQRILLELLNQMDGFDRKNKVKVIMATNRIDTLDPALLRPGRLDRKIEFPLPDKRQRRLIFQSCTAKMNLEAEVDLQEFFNRPGAISAADIAAVCQAAGMHAIRNNRYIVLHKDFERGWEDHIKSKQQIMDFYSM